jgi:hypothetical protein
MKDPRIPSFYQQVTGVSIAANAQIGRTYAPEEQKKTNMEKSVL